MNDDFFLPDFINNQIIADGKSPKFDLRVASPIYGVSAIRADIFDTSNQPCGCFRVVVGYIGKNLIEIGESATFIAKLHPR